MLESVKLSFFQQHRDLEVTLGQGLTAIRGANEAGKSTLLRGICYALFGAKAMPDTLENLVTWGEDVKKLKSEVTFTADGVRYHVKRSKSGAELNYDGGRVTGQNEVTNFICRLLKVDAAAAPRLMLSNQNEIRGALEAGPKETTALIERLANFSQIDELIELLQQELVTGSVAPAEAAVDAARTALDAAREAAEKVPDVDALDLAISRAQTQLEAAAGDGGDAQERLTAAQGNLNDAKVVQAEREGVLRIIGDAEERVDAIEAELRTLQAVEAPDNVEGRVQALRDRISTEERRAELQERKDRVAEIDADVRRFEGVAAPTGDVGLLRAQLANHERAGEVRKKWLQVQPFMTGRAAQYEKVETFTGSIQDLEAAIAQDLADAEDYARLAAKKASEAALLRQQITDGSCGFCGQDFSNVAAVKEKNDRLLAQAAAADATRLEALTCEQRCREMAARRKAIKEASQPALRALAVVGADYAALADDVLPPVLKWVASPYSEVRTDVAELQRQIEEIEAAQRAYDRAQAKLEALRAERARLVDGLPETLPAPADARALKREIRDLEAAQEAYRSAQARVQALADERDRLCLRMEEAREHLPPPVDLAPLQRAVDGARAALEPAQRAVQQAQTALFAAKQAKVDALAAYERARAAAATAEQALEQRQKELADLRFNNKLLKDVRAARPVISDKLWNMVLGAVSRYFSEMRGQESVVTKGQDGFMVDGHVVSSVSLSGSALDILGLAIRVALVKTFLPACPFFVLDEPAQGCDDNRTANLLSFLSACGFAQVLLVTHEDTSESVAENMITLGA